MHDFVFFAIFYFFSFLFNLYIWALRVPEGYYETHESEKQEMEIVVDYPL